MREIDPVTALRAFSAKYPNQRDACKAMGVSQAFFNDMLNGRRNVSQKALDALGLRRIVVKA